MHKGRHLSVSNSSDLKLSTVGTQGWWRDHVGLKAEYIRIGTRNKDAPSMFLLPTKDTTFLLSSQRARPEELVWGSFRFRVSGLWFLKEGLELRGWGLGCEL